MARSQWLVEAKKIDNQIKLYPIKIEMQKASLCHRCFHSDEIKKVYADFYSAKE